MSTEAARLLQNILNAAGTAAAKVGEEMAKQPGSSIDWNYVTNLLEVVKQAIAAVEAAKDVPAA